MCNDRVPSNWWSLTELSIGWTRLTLIQVMSCRWFGAKPFHESMVTMMTSSNGFFCVTGHLCGEFTGDRWITSQRPVTRSLNVFFDLCLNKRLSNQSWGWWFETPSRPLRRHCIVIVHWTVRKFSKNNAPKYTISHKTKIHLNMSSVKCRQICESILLDGYHAAVVVYSRVIV